MKAGRGLVTLLCVGALFLSGSGVAWSQEPEKEPEPKKQEDAKDPEAEVEGKTDVARPGEPSREGTEDDTTVPKPREINESVTVTAQRVETDLMKTPIAVTVFDQDTLDREGVQNIRDLSDMVPNMDIATINGQSTPIISLRGVRSTNETELGDPAVGVHLDGIYSPRMQGILGLMFDNERVEVLRGPQGTLFGRNSTVGNINIVTAKPKLDKFDVLGNIRIGNYGSREASAMINVPVTRTFGLRLAARAFQRDSYIDGYWDPNQYDQRRIADKVADAPVIATGSFDECTSPRCYTRTQKNNWWIDTADGGYDVRALVPADRDDFYMNADEWAYRLSALWEPIENLSFNLSWQRFRTDSAGGIDLVNCDKLRGRPVRDEDGVIIGKNDCADLFPKDETYQAVVNTPGRFFLDIDYLRSQVTWDIGEDLRFVYLAGFEDMDRESAQDMEQALNAWDQAMFFLPGTGSKSWAHEIQLQSYGDKKFNWIAGINYFHEKTSTIGYFDNAIGEKALWDQPDRSADASAMFAQGTYSFTPQWHLTLGYRYSDETKEDRGGNTYLCDVGQEVPSTGEDCMPGYLERAAYNALPTSYFEDPANYATISPNDNKGSWSHNDFRIGLDYDVNPDTLLYSYLASGFKAGGIGDVYEATNPRTGEHIVARTSFDPEEVVTLELGLKQRLLGGKLDLRGAYFYSDYEDMQYASVGALAINERYERLRDPVTGEPILDEDGFPVFGFVPYPIVAYYTQNVPGARIQGVELEYDWRPWTGGRIHGYGSWLETEINQDWITKWSYDPVSYFGLGYEDSIDPENPQLQVNMKGNELAVSPPVKLHMTLEHSFYVPKANMAIVPWVTAHWEYDSYLTIWNVDKHTDDLNFVILDEDIRYTDDRREAWSMVHAGVRVFRGRWMFELFGYNLTDEVVQYWGGAAEQVAKGSFSMPRNYGFQLSWNF